MWSHDKKMSCSRNSTTLAPASSVLSSRDHFCPPLPNMCSPLKLVSVVCSAPQGLAEDYSVVEQLSHACFSQAAPKEEERANNSESLKMHPPGFLQWIHLPISRLCVTDRWQKPEAGQGHGDLGQIARTAPLSAPS